jgi:hypothetical protein
VISLIGTGAELIFLQHYEDAWQLLPLGLLALALAVVVWHALSRGTASVLALRVLMAAFIASGAIGTGLHYQANAEFEREMDPSLSGFELFGESLSGALPVLAPGTMIQLGMLGLLYTYRHPRLTAAANQEQERDT